MLFRLFKLLVVLAILAFGALTGYSYLGPYFGVDFRAPQTEIREPVTLETR